MFQGCEGKGRLIVNEGLNLSFSLKRRDTMKDSLRFLVITTIGCLLLAGCSNRPAEQETNWEPTPYDTVNNFEGVTLDFKEGTVSEAGGTVIWKNDTDREYTYGKSFVMEKKVDGNWRQVPVIEKNYGFEDIGYILNASDRQEQIIEWEWLYGVLAEGEYRLVKDIYDVSEPGDSKQYNLAAEFVLE